MLTTRAEIRAFFGPKNKSNAIRMVLPMRGLNSTTQLASVCDRFQYGGRDLKFIKNIRKSKNSMLKEKFKVLQPLLASIMLDKFPAKYYVLEENERFDDIVESQAEKGKAEERIEDIVKIVCQNCDHDAFEHFGDMDLSTPKAGCLEWLVNIIDLYRLGQLMTDSLFADDEKKMFELLRDKLAERVRKNCFGPIDMGKIGELLENSDAFKELPPSMSSSLFEARSIEYILYNFVFSSTLEDNQVPKKDGIDMAAFIIESINNWCPSVPSDKGNSNTEKNRLLSMIREAWLMQAFLPKRLSSFTQRPATQIFGRVVLLAQLPEIEDFVNKRFEFESQNNNKAFDFNQDNLRQFFTLFSIHMANNKDLREESFIDVAELERKVGKFDTFNTPLDTAADHGNIVFDDFSGSKVNAAIFGKDGACNWDVHEHFKALFKDRHDEHEAKRAQKRSAADTPDGESAAKKSKTSNHASDGTNQSNEANYDLNGGAVENLDMVDVNNNNNDDDNNNNSNYNDNDSNISSNNNNNNNNRNRNRNRNRNNKRKRGGKKGKKAKKIAVDNNNKATPNTKTTSRSKVPRRNNKTLTETQLKEIWDEWEKFVESRCEEFFSKLKATVQQPVEKSFDSYKELHFYHLKQDNYIHDRIIKHGQIINLRIRLLWLSVSEAILKELPGLEKMTVYDVLAGPNVECLLFFHRRRVVSVLVFRICKPKKPEVNENPGVNGKPKEDEEPETFAEILFFVTIGEYQRQQLGSNLLKRFFKLVFATKKNSPAKKANKEVQSIALHSDGDAIGFYKKFDFTKVTDAVEVQRYKARMEVSTNSVLMKLKKGDAPSFIADLPESPSLETLLEQSEASGSRNKRKLNAARLDIFQKFENHPFYSIFKHANITNEVQTTLYHWNYPLENIEHKISNNFYAFTEFYYDLLRVIIPYRAIAPTKSKLYKATDKIADDVRQWFKAAGIEEPF